jgi:hypothetical protein
MPLLLELACVAPAVLYTCRADGAHPDEVPPVDLHAREDADLPRLHNEEKLRLHAV